MFELFFPSDWTRDQAAPFAGVLQQYHCGLLVVLTITFTPFHRLVLRVFDYYQLEDDGTLQAA